jgi:hypothetical protein
MNAPHLCKLRKECLTGICHGALVLTKRLYFVIFQLPKAEKDHCAHLNWFPNWQLKNKEALEYFTELSEDGGGGEGAKFAENLSASPFYKDLSNETTFSPIHLAGQYL